VLFNENCSSVLVNENSDNVCSSFQEFLAKLNSEIALAASYELPEAQAEARAVVPLQRLEASAREKATRVGEGSTSVYRDFLLSELVDWFKTEFFSWFDAAKCESCNKAMQNDGLGSATPEELADGASRIEL